MIPVPLKPKWLALKAGRTGFPTQHFHRLIGLASVHLYKARRAALDFVESQWPGLEDCHLWRSQGARIACVELRVRCLLASAAGEPANRKSLLKAARRDIRALLKESSNNSKAQALKDQAVALALEGHRDEAQASFVEAEISLENEGMATHVQSVRWMRGHLLGSTQGDELKTAATAALVEAGYRNPKPPPAVRVRNRVLPPLKPVAHRIAAVSVHNGSSIGRRDGGDILDLKHVGTVEEIEDIGISSSFDPPKLKVRDARRSTVATEGVVSELRPIPKGRSDVPSPSKLASEPTNCV